MCPWQVGRVSFGRFVCHNEKIIGDCVGIKKMCTFAAELGENPTDDSADSSPALADTLCISLTCFYRITLTLIYSVSIVLLLKSLSLFALQATSSSDGR